MTEPEQPVLLPSGGALKGRPFQEPPVTCPFKTETISNPCIKGKNVDVNAVEGQPADLWEPLLHVSKPFSKNDDITMQK